MAGEDGSVTDSLIDMMVRLAEGGVGLIISGHAYVRGEGQAVPRQLGIHNDQFMDGLTRMAVAVHSAGGRMAIQLAHAGSASYFPGIDLIAPSAVSGQPGQPSAREMTRTDIETVVDAFAEAARRAQNTGYDAVQIHAAHGYLIGQFLSPALNKRTDEFGGGVQNRARFLVMVVKAVRRAVGADFPILIKMNSEDFVPSGMTVEDMLQTIPLVKEAGIDAIELSGGSLLAGKNNPIRLGRPEPCDPEAYYEAAARRAKQQVTTPIILVGGIRNLETAERLVTEGAVDYIALCRPLICEPDLANRWRSGDRRPSKCPSDNGCMARFTEMIKGSGLSCAMKERNQDS
jgi:2,4-dienoyl-CoA reductase-like NADH-dependent reductase (Old Yellow Enzyme family)